MVADGELGIGRDFKILVIGYGGCMVVWLHCMDRWRGNKIRRGRVFYLNRFNSSNGYDKRVTIMIYIGRESFGWHLEENNWVLVLILGFRFVYMHRWISGRGRRKGWKGISWGCCEIVEVDGRMD